MNYLVETYNTGNYNDKSAIKDENKKQKDLKLLETRQVVQDYLNTNFILEPNNQETKDNLSNYLNLVKERYTEFKNVIFRFYNLFAAPVPY